MPVISPRRVLQGNYTPNHLRLPVFALALALHTYYVDRLGRPRCCSRVPSPALALSAPGTAGPPVKCVTNRQSIRLATLAVF